MSTTALPASNPSPPNEPHHDDRAALAPSKPLATNIELAAITTTTLPAFRRLLALLLPIPYKDRFFSEILDDASISNISRVALWHAPRTTNKRSHDGQLKISAAAAATAAATATAATAAIATFSTPDRTATSDDRTAGHSGAVVGGIRCRLEPVPYPPTEHGTVVRQQLYVQTLAVLAPYRGHGIATHLLDEVVARALAEGGDVESVYAHVWEKNAAALEWYEQRGFQAEDEVVVGYYRRLKPAGAVVLRKKVARGEICDDQPGDSMR